MNTPGEISDAQSKKQTGEGTLPPLGLHLCRNCHGGGPDRSLDVRSVKLFINGAAWETVIWMLRGLFCLLWENSPRRPGVGPVSSRRVLNGSHAGSLLRVAAFTKGMLRSEVHGQEACAEQAALHTVVSCALDPAALRAQQSPGQYSGAGDTAPWCRGHQVPCRAAAHCLLLQPGSPNQGTAWRGPDRRREHMGKWPGGCGFCVAKISVRHLGLADAQVMSPPLSHMCKATWGAGGQPRETARDSKAISRLLGALQNEMEMQAQRS